jgi:hypothetical protein
MAVIALAGATHAAARMPRFHHAVAKSRVLRDARANRVVIVLKTQHRGRLATAASVRARASVQTGGLSLVQGAMRSAMPIECGAVSTKPWRA